MTITELLFGHDENLKGKFQEFFIFDSKPYISVD